MTIGSISSFLISAVNQVSANHNIIAFFTDTSDWNPVDLFFLLLTILYFGCLTGIHVWYQQFGSTSPDKDRSSAIHVMSPWPRMYTMYEVLLDRWLIFQFVEAASADSISSYVYTYHVTNMFPMSNSTHVHHPVCFNVRELLPSIILRKQTRKDK